MEFVAGKHVGGAIRVGQHERVRQMVGIAILVGERHAIALGVPVRHEHAGFAAGGDVLRNVFDRQVSTGQ